MNTARSFWWQKAINYGKHLPLAHLASFYYRFPSRKLKVIGVTGTDGKTTTVNLIYEILKEAQLPVAMVSTVSAKIGNEEIDTGFHVTAPDPWLLQKLLRKMVKQKIGYVVLEVTSHGLDQFRLFGILHYQVGILTNITHEHLDYHQTFANYRNAKLKMFLKSKIAVLNKDDESYEFISSKLKTKSAKLLTYGIKKEADFTPKTFPFETKLPGEYNQYNCLAAIAAASSLHIAPEVIRRAVGSFAGVTGRMEEVNEGQNFRAIVDFAHTLNALTQVLAMLRDQLTNRGKLIVVFGAAGERDKTKRPLMGEAAAKYADLIILTAEDPRTENAADICQQIAEGCPDKNKLKIMIDREQAINWAMGQAKRNDIVIVCGKGHEKSMCFGQTEYPWSDQEAVRAAVKKIVGAQRAAPAEGGKI